MERILIVGADLVRASVLSAFKSEVRRYDKAYTELRSSSVLEPVPTASTPSPFGARKLDCWVPGGVMLPSVSSPGCPVNVSHCSLGRGRLP